MPVGDKKSSEPLLHLPSSSSPPPRTTLDENLYLSIGSLSGRRGTSHQQSAPSNTNRASLSVESTCIHISEDDEKIRSIPQIFPSKSREEVVDILKSSASLEEATNRILDCSNAEDILKERGALFVEALLKGERDYPLRKPDVDNN